MTETADTYDKSLPLRDLAVGYMMSMAGERTDRDKFLATISNMLKTFLEEQPSHYPWLHEIVDAIDLILDHGGSRKK